jgi:dephospho-CoA kinase
MIRIAFTGWAGSAKTTAAQYLRSKYDFEIISFADGIKFIDSYLFGSGKKNRERLQKIGELFRREFDPDIWVKRTIESIEAEEGNVVVDDLRRLNEYEALKNKNFHIVRIVADEDVRVERLMKRDGQCDVSLMYNESENGCADLALPEIENNGSLEEFYARLDEMMERLYE